MNQKYILNPTWFKRIYQLNKLNTKYTNVFVSNNLTQVTKMRRYFQLNTYVVNVLIVQIKHEKNNVSLRFIKYD